MTAPSDPSRSLSWLLAPDDPGPRYLALRDLLHCPPEDREWRDARTRRPPANSRPLARHPARPYVTTLLQGAEALIALGYGDDPRLARTPALVATKADEAGRWPLEYDYAGKLWDGVDFEPKKRPNLASNPNSILNHSTRSGSPDRWRSSPDYRARSGRYTAV